MVPFRPLVVSIALILAAVLADPAHAVSFDCAHPQLTEDRALCADPEIQGLEHRLDQLLTNVASGHSAPARARLAADQGGWQRLAGIICPTSLRLPAPAGPYRRQDCLVLAYHGRLDQLVRARLVPRPWYRSDLYRARWLGSETTVETGAWGAFPGFAVTAIAYARLDRAGAEGFDRASEAAASQLAADAEAAAAEANADISVDFALAASAGGDRISLDFAATILPHGAAHGWARHAALHWLLPAGRPMVADDLFQPAADWRSALAAFAAAASPDGATPPDAAILADPGHWRLESDQLVLLTLADDGEERPVPIARGALAPFLRPLAPW